MIDSIVVPNFVSQILSILGVTNMPYISHYPDLVGKDVILTKEKESMIGKFTVGTKVKITECDPIRGYTFTDSEGNRITEAGFDGFEVVK